MYRNIGHTRSIDDNEQRQMMFYYFGILLLVSVVNAASIPSNIESLLEGVPVRDDLDEHSDEFNQPEMIKLTDKLYFALGYGLANTIYILAPEGVIVVDTLESAKAATAAFNDFRKLHPNAEIKAIIYTHNHGDHNEGTKVYIQDPSNPPDIWAHHTLADAMKSHITAGPTLFVRAARQFGFHLPQGKPWFVNNGIGYRIVNEEGGKSNKTGLVWPNRFVMEDELDVVIAGLKVKLLHTPGETPDHLGVYIPNMETFMCGDNLYKTFPNLYAIRGTTLRDPMLWVESLDKIRRLQPSYLLPSHTRPVVGKENVMNVITMYRDGIQFVHDQTIRLVNRGFHPDVVATMLELPPQQKVNRYLREHYGTIEWSSKAVYNQYFGWFSGDVVELLPFTRLEEAKRAIQLAGGIQNLLDKANSALLNKDYPWALLLATYIIKLDKNHTIATSIRKDAMKALAGQHPSPNARNYYLTSVLEDAGVVQMRSKTKARNFALNVPLEQLFRFLSFGININTCATENIKILLSFTDKVKVYMLHLRNGILEVKSTFNKHNSKIDCKINKVSEEVFRQVIGQLKSHDVLIQPADNTNDCDKLILQKFFNCFELTSPDYDFGFGSQ